MTELVIFVISLSIITQYKFRPVQYKMKLIRLLHHDVMHVIMNVAMLQHNLIVTSSTSYHDVMTLSYKILFLLIQ